MTIEKVVIVGAGQGGYQVAASLRQEGFGGDITLVSDEPGWPYQRPPLSKAYLQGDITKEQLALRAPKWFEDQRVSVRHARAVGIDRASRQLLLAGGEALPYDHLVLATGARNRALPLPGADLPNVVGIRTHADAEALAPMLRDARRAVVIGAGFIGLEFAAVAAKRGVAVQVLELADRPMARAVSLPMSQYTRGVHEGWGVQFRFGEGIAGLEAADGRVVAVLTTGGERLETDLVVVGIGVVPNTELAQEAGLTVDNGIRVDAVMRTSDPSISAIGDAVAFPCPHAGGQCLRLESVQNAVDQARTLAASLMGKDVPPYGALPWFWSDQGDMKLQIAGLSQGHDQTVVLPQPQPNQLTVLCFRGGRMIAVETVNRPADHMVARKLLARDPKLTPEMASAPGFDLKAHEAATR